MPLPDYKVIPDGWSQHHRPTAEQAMTAEVEWRRPATAATFDETTGRTEYPTPAPYHAGPARIQRSALGQQPAEVGDRQVTIRPYQVSLPADAPTPAINDQGTVTVCPDDSQLVGQQLRVVDVRAGSLLWQRDLVCDLIPPTSR